MVGPVAGVMRRVVRWSVVFVSAVALSAIAGAGTAWAAEPSGVTVTGPGVPGPGALTLNATTQHEQFDRVFRLVNWMASDPGDPMEVKPALLGPMYTVDVLVGGVASQRYEIYPLAQGGPRAHRPARQPSGRTTSDAWFYASVLIPQELAAVGVPIAGFESYQLTRAVSSRTETSTVPMNRARAMFLMNFAACVALGVVLTGALAALARRISRLGL